MGWHNCEKCMSDSWELHVYPRGCDQCNPGLEGEVKMEVQEFFKRNANKKLVAGMAVS